MGDATVKQFNWINPLTGETDVAATIDEARKKAWKQLQEANRLGCPLYPQLPKLDGVHIYTFNKISLLATADTNTTKRLSCLAQIEIAKALNRIADACEKWRR
jgi:hypothetical protein